MYKSNPMEEEEVLPSWLKEEKQPDSHERTPLIHKSTSYGNKSDTASNVEEDYGDDGFPPNTQPYHDLSVPLGGFSYRNQHPVTMDHTSWSDHPKESNTTPSGNDSDDEESSSSEDDDEESTSSYSSTTQPSSTKLPLDEEQIPPTPPRTKRPTKSTRTKESYSQKKRDKLKLKRADYTTEEDYDDEDEEPPLIRPRRNCCHSFFILIQITAILGNLAMLAIQVLPVVMSKSLDTLQIVIRCYFTVFIIMMILAELEILKHGGLGNWIVKGFLMTFLGVVAFEQETIALTALNRQAYWGAVWSSVFFQVASWWMIGVGCLYFLMGLLCMKKILRRCREGYQRRMIEYKKELKAQLKRH